MIPVKKVASSTISLIDELIVEYPNLQISVPVHAEDLENESYIPPVTFVTVEAYKGTADYLVSYQGVETSLIDAKIEPENAIVVVGLK